MKLLNDKDYEKLTAEKKADERERKGKVAKLTVEVAELKERLESQERENKKATAKLVDAHEAALAKSDKALKAMTEERDVYKQLENNSADTKKLEVQLQTRERVLKAKEDAFADIEKELSANRKKAEEAREEGIKKGYADGVADGLREATKITAEDRKMAMQVALVSAASHTPDAATELAKQAAQEVAKNALAIPATTKKR